MNKEQVKAILTKIDAELDDVVDTVLDDLTDDLKKQIYDTINEICVDEVDEAFRLEDNLNNMVKNINSNKQPMMMNASEVGAVASALMNINLSIKSMKKIDGIYHIEAVKIS